MTHSIAHRLRVAIPPLVALVAVACGSAASTGITETIDGSEPAATSGEDGGGSSLAPAGARSYYSFDPTGTGLVRVDPDNGEVAEVLDAWLAPDHRYFKVRGNNGACYILRNDVVTGRWELTMFDRTGAIG